MTAKASANWAVKWRMMPAFAILNQVICRKDPVAVRFAVMLKASGLLHSGHPDDHRASHGVFVRKGS